ncbi:MAG: T9SS type A sorting domain-containing protein [Lewinellaceae bacterium]|nr:T9SS type A sorting domain-containing protein [Lewinellaceae bacterium]
MGKTNFTFVYPGWTKAFGLMLAAILWAGLQSASAQCNPLTAVSASGITDDAATITWTSANGDPDHAYQLILRQEADNDGLGDGPWAFISDVYYPNGGGPLSYTFTGLVPSAWHQVCVREFCDDDQGVTSFLCTTFQTYATPFSKWIEDVNRPSCPFVSPGYVANGDFTIEVQDGSCTGTYTVSATPIAGSGPLGSTPPFTTITTYIGFPDGQFFFGNAGAGQYTVTVTETSGCNFAPGVNPMSITVTVQDGIDVTAPLIYLQDWFGNIVADTDGGSPVGSAFNKGSVTVPEGECGFEEKYWVFGTDNCDDVLLAENSFSASAVTTPATINPGTQASIVNTPNGLYGVTIHWSTGSSTVTVTGKDASNNTASVTVTANVPDNVDPVVTILGNTQVTIPVCATSVSAIYSIQVDDNCDQAAVNFNNLVPSFGGATGVLNFTGNNYREYIVTFPSAGNYLFSASYTDAYGNVGFLDIVIQVQQAAANQPPVVIAADANHNIPSCLDADLFCYSFQVTDDCEDINPALLTFNSGGSGLTITYTDVDNANNTAFFEACGNVAPGGYIFTINYNGTVVQPLVNVVQDAPAGAVVTMPGNLNFTIPVCQPGLETTFAIQIHDDCDSGADIAGAAQFFLGATEIFPSFVNAANDHQAYFEFTETLTAADNGNLLAATYTDGDGILTATDALITVTDQPDNWAPIVVYPSQDINVTLDPCEEGPAVIFFEVTATDNCSGELAFSTTPASASNPSWNLAASPVTGIGGIVFAGIGGATVTTVADPGSYQIVITAVDAAGNVRQEDFFITVTQAPRPVDNLSCLSQINATLNGNCQFELKASNILTGNFGCLTDADFEIEVADGNPSNGGIIDGPGTYQYSISLVTPDPTVGFTGDFAPANWAYLIQNNGSISFNGTNTAVTITGPDGAFCLGCEASMNIAMPGAGTVSFDYDWTNLDIAFGPFYDAFIALVNSNGTITILANTDGQAAGSGTVTADVQAGDVLIMGVLSDDGTFGPGIVTIDNFSFQPEAAAGVNFTTCWGTVTAEDKTPPVVACPPDINSVTVNKSVQLITGALANTDPTLDPNNYSCLLDAANPPVGIHRYDLYSFTVSKTDVYTFLMESAWGDGLAALYQGSFDPTNPCENVIMSFDDAVLNVPYGLFDPVARLALPLQAGKTYILYTSSWPANTTGNYTWHVFADNGGKINGLASTTEALTFDLLCSDVDNIYNNDNSYALTGLATPIDNCSATIIDITDELTETGDCGPIVINRTYEVEDVAGNTASCTQEIRFRRPTLFDLILPSFTSIVECDEGYPVDANGHPAPSLTGYPFIQTAFGVYDLNQSYCNLGASYVDQTPIVVCQGAYKVLRQWTVIDWCQPGSSFFYNQIIKVGDFTGPQIVLPTFDYDWNGEPDIMTVSTGPFDCTASFPVPAVEVSDLCSPDGTTTEAYIIPEGSTDPDDYIYPTPNGFFTNIPLGCHVIRYVAEDGCGNSTVADLPFSVQDLVEPIAVCDDDLHISIGGQGYARVYAEDIDEGSSDNCGPIRIEVRRQYTLDPETCEDVPDFYSPWGPYVDITCCDVNSTVRIELRVWDDRNGDGIAGNAIPVTFCDGSTKVVEDNKNICWLDVLVEDKVPPFCTPPHAVTLTCVDVPYDLDPQNEELMNGYFGEATGVDNCPGVTVGTVSVTDGRNDCGFGTIIRRFRATDAKGLNSTNTCQQVITVTELHNYEIRFPKDAQAICGEPNPDTILTNEIGCDILSVNVHDDKYTADADECYKILRRYRVINWCEWDGISTPIVISRDEDCDNNPGDEAVWVMVRPNGVTYVDRDNNENNNNPPVGTSRCTSLPKPNGHWARSTINTELTSVGHWEYTQVIKVYDNIDPVVTYESGEFCSYDNVDCDGEVEIPVTVDETCSPDGLEIRVWLDAFADGVLDGEITASALSGSYPNYTISGTFPIGHHSFAVTVRDGCENQTGVNIPFDVVDCKAPTPICINGLAVELMPVIPAADADGDGDDDNCAMAVWAVDFIASPITDCTPPIKYSINRVGEAADIDATGLIMTQDDPETLVVEIHAWDGAGNHDYCETYVLVQNNQGLCGTGGNGSISGVIETETSQSVEGVETNLSGNAIEQMMTGNNGTYQFAGLQTDYDYSVTPHLDANPLNGVSTFDLVLLAKHILGVQLLDSPYKMIAADVNNSKSISTLDAIQLRKLILNIDTQFSNNTSWRFVPQNYAFPVPSNPWFETFPEVININDLPGEMVDQDFVGVKIGDLNGSVQANALSAEDRNLEGVFNLNVADIAMKAGNEYRVAFTAPEIEKIQGYQLTLSLNTEAAEVVDMVYGVAAEENFGMRFVKDGMITTSWNGEAKAGDELFSLVIRATTDAQLSDVLGVSSRYTVAEAYDLNDATKDVAINFTSGVVATAGFELYQNTPNPFKASTQIGFNLPEAAQVTLTIQDATGKVVRLVREDLGKGQHNLTVDRGNLPAGVLYYTVSTDKYTATKKMIVVE